MPSDSPVQREASEQASLSPALIYSLIYVAGTASPQSRSPSPSGNDVLTLRALVSTKDAGVIIGKAGKNVADLRDQTGVKAGVSKVVPGVHERVLTVSGSVEGVAKVCPRVGFPPCSMPDDVPGVRSHSLSIDVSESFLPHHDVFLPEYLHTSSHFPQSHGQRYWS